MPFGTREPGNHEASKLAAAAEFWTELHAPRGMGKEAIDPAQAALVGGGALLAGGAGALLQHARAKPQVGGQSRLQVKQDRAEAEAAAHAQNEGKEPPAPGFVSGLDRQYVDWAAQHPGGAAAVGAAPWAVAGGLAGSHLHQLWQEVLAAKALAGA